MISLEEAHVLISKIAALDPELAQLENALGRICVDDVYATVDCPTVDSSLKDGFAVVANDIAEASREHPVTLYVNGTLTAGDEPGDAKVGRGEAIRIMTGGQIPQGATSVVASEFTSSGDSVVTVCADADAGRNILSRGSDMKKGQLVISAGTQLGPAHLGLLASAGIGAVNCSALPRVAIAATGTELVWPGEHISEGKVAASNMVTAKAEFSRLGCTASTSILRDNLEELEEQLKVVVREIDLLITCGGVLDGDKDLTMRAMDRLGMEKIFHRVRIGPGKGVCLGRLGKTIVCNLPGGPPSNHAALILLALPVCRQLMGYEHCFPVKRSVLLQETVSGQKGWTQLFYSRVGCEKGMMVAQSLGHMGRLQALGSANALVELPEHSEGVYSGSSASAWVYDSGNIL